MTDGAFIAVVYGILAAGVVMIWLVTKLLCDRLDDIANRLRAMTDRFDTTVEPPVQLDERRASK